MCGIGHRERCSGICVWLQNTVDDMCVVWWGSRVAPARVEKPDIRDTLLECVGEFFCVRNMKSGGSGVQSAPLQESEMAEHTFFFYNCYLC